MFSGAVNATATVADLPLVVIMIVWGVAPRLSGGRCSAGGARLIVPVSVWWAASLMKLERYSPPFFDYVEDARRTTQTTGYISGAARR